MTWPTVGEVGAFGWAIAPEGFTSELYTYDGFDGLAKPQSQRRIVRSDDPTVLPVPTKWWLLSPTEQDRIFRAETWRALGPARGRVSSAR